MLVKSCPFCGSKPYIEESQRGYVDGQSTKVCYVRCSVCNARSMRVNLADYGRTSYSSKAVEDVVEAWNSRTENIIEYDISGHHKTKTAIA